MATARGTNTKLRQSVRKSTKNQPIRTDQRVTRGRPPLSLGTKNTLHQASQFTTPAHDGQMQLELVGCSDTQVRVPGDLSRAGSPVVRPGARDSLGLWAT